MGEFIAFAIYLSVSVCLLIIAPVMMHPTLPAKRKLFISLISFIVLVPLGLTLYAWLGVPQMAQNG